MELNDYAFPNLAGVVSTENQSLGFKDVRFAFFVGAKPRGILFNVLGPGMERNDLSKIMENLRRYWKGHQ